MNLMLKIVGPDGEVTELPVDDARLEVVAVPGHSYRLVADASPQDPNAKQAPVPAASGPRALRIEDDLLVDQIDGGYPITLTGFFSNCADGNQCELVIETAGQEVVTLTPTSEPIAAYAEGGFLMYVNDSSEAVAQSLPKAPETEIQFDWRPWAAVGGGLLVVAGAAGGSGGSVGSDSTAPSAPTISSGTETNSPFPVFSGTAEPGSTIRLSVQVGEGASAVVANYSTQPDALGNWSVDTATSQPTSGQFPAQGIQQDQTGIVSIIATNASGNLSEPVTSNIVFDNTPPATPTIAATDELAPGSGGTVFINSVEAQDGVEVSGTAEANSTVNVTLTGVNYMFAGQALADESGNYSVTVAPGELAPDGSELTLSVTATDPAGNVSTPAQTALTIDTSLSGATANVTAFTDNLLPVTGAVTNGITNDTSPTIRGTVTGELDAGEVLHVLRDGDLVGAAQVSANGAAWAFTDDLTAIADAEGVHNYQVRIADNAGNLGDASNPLALTVDLTAPAQTVTIDTVVDNNGLRPVTISSGGITDDRTPTVRLSLSDVLGDGESVQIIRSLGGNVAIAAELTAQDAVNGVFEFEDQLLSAGVVGYQAQVVDGAGLAGDASAVYAVRILFPVEEP